MSSCDTFMDQTTCENQDDNMDCIWETDGNTQPQCIDASDQTDSQPPPPAAPPARVRGQDPDLKKDFDKALSLMYLSIPIHLVCYGVVFLKKKLAVELGILVFGTTLAESLKIFLYFHYKNQLPTYNTPEYDDSYEEYNEILKFIYVFTFLIWAASIIYTIIIAVDRTGKKTGKKPATSKNKSKSKP